MKMSGSNPPGQMTCSRREVVSTLPLGAAALSLAPGLLAQGSMPTRPIPGTIETLPIIGLGSTRPVSSIPELGSERVEAIVRALVEHGGRVIDTWPRDAANDLSFGAILGRSEWRDQLFVSTNVEEDDAAAGIAQLRRVMSNFGRESIDLVNVGSLTGLDVQWPNLKAFRDAGRARYIGVTAARAELYDRLEGFLATETPDFVMLNYSVTEREAEQRFLPMLADRGIAVLVSRPFMNGAYFERLENEPLPKWAAEFDCGSWSQFSLQYILANPNVTCVLTETTNPMHMAENALTASKPLPDESARQRMRMLIDAL